MRGRWNAGRRGFVGVVVPAMRFMLRLSRSRALVGLALVAVVGTGGCARDDGPRRLTLAHSLEPTHTVHTAMVRMAERVHELSDGELAVEIYASGQLGEEREMIELLQIGSLAMTKVSASPLEAFVPEMRVFNLPYLFRDHAHYLSVLDSAIGEALLRAPERARVRGLGYYDAGSRSFYTVDHDVQSPADLAGLKIRVQPSRTAMQTVAALGGAPTPISWGELYTALQQRVVDGAENNPPSFFTSGHYEVARYFTLDEHTAVPDLLLISARVWAGLSAEQQGWLERAVQESVEYQRELWRTDTEDALAAVEAAGVTIVRPDKRSFQDAVATLLEEHERGDLGDLIRAIREHGMQGK